MRGEVIKLQEMIQSAVEEYELQLKQVVKEKNEEIQILIKQLKKYEKQPESKEDFSIRI
jgi:hypothetical protein